MDTSPLFNQISGNYDRFNHLFSMNIDRSWRKNCARLALKLASGMASSRNVQVSDIRVLDLACGTADLSILLARKGLKVVGADISEGMLEVGRKKIEERWKEDCARYPRPELQTGDGANLPFADGSFDIVTIGYGIRNFDNRPQSLKEILRVLSPGGALLILEFGKPRNALMRMLYAPYFKYMIPGLASALTKGKDKGAYKYFIGSVEKFPKFEMFCKELSQAGFADVGYKSQTGGISVLYKAFKAK
ncbi:MAG: ubiquinone/menaquinone biosynthesis methyltransferase [Bacteroidales bacterium]|nr:ubiquinone/menaquinone biosynthesis methyltransferase [Bacteroidales bacterium]MBR2135800.1 ubiquinone/menaquinone biosynthesis methyltransferase [Bacteroidales bacterium]